MKAFVAIPYSDSTGKHNVGDEVEFDPSEREGVDILINYGILSKTAPTPDKNSPRQG